jgi:RNA polymerase-interacting CarD/CdnL/TRCF family regulator
MQTMTKGLKINDKIVHTTWGGGYIRNITTKHVAEEAIECYEIELLLNTSRVFVPKANLDVADVRLPGTKAENKKAIEILRGRKGRLANDWKARVTFLKNRLEQGTLKVYAQTVKDLRSGYLDDTISSTERKIYCRAYDLLASEIALIRDCDIADAHKYIENQLSD